MGHYNFSSTGTVLLKTALVDIYDSNNVKRTARICLDGGGEGSLVKEHFLQQFDFPKQKVDMEITGVGDIPAFRSKWKVNMRLVSKVNSSFVDVELYSAPSCTGTLNRLQRGQATSWNHLQGLQLADPQYHHAGQVDILIGADVVPYIIRDGIRKTDRMSPVAQNTIFGWVIFGNVASSAPTQISSRQINSFNMDPNNILRRFWEIEEVPDTPALSPEEAACEKHFTETHTRNEQGRYIVRLPFNGKKPTLGSTKEIAFRRLLALERRFLQNPQHKDGYIQFMREYQALGHMEAVPYNQLSLGKAYLPHHFVIKEDSTTTKLRIVFDGSAKSSSGVSLNDTLMVGATVQPDLFTLILRFRMKRIAMKLDIKQMYRQFLVHPEDQHYQRILWRESPSDPVKEYNLKTVTYGMASAPFAATRSLNQLAIDEQDNFPAAAVAINQNTYVDDFLGCADTEQEATDLIRELIGITERGGMEMRKWCSNVPVVLSSLPDNFKEECSSFDLEESGVKGVKALGIRWHPASDNFMFKVNITPSGTVTKRLMLSEIAKTFDPIGWLSPVTIKAKRLLQKVWMESKSWDETVSEHLVEQWNDYQRDLKKLEEMRIPRCIVMEAVAKFEVHGFSDSSELAMAAAVYLKCFYESGQVGVRLITSKTKVTPLKAISLSKLELNAAKLLAELMHCIQSALSIPGEKYYWTDSTITLRWISSHSRRWKTFVANRVSTIQTLTDPENWHHVRSEDNPADLPSRGITAEQLISSSLWNHGAPFLQHAIYPVYSQNCNEDEVKKEEKSKQLAVFCFAQKETQNLVFNAFSKLHKLVRACVYYKRFIAYLKSKSADKQEITTSEYNHVLTALIIWAQKETFLEDIGRLQKTKNLSSSSKLLQLNPYLDNEGVLRVGGRIQRAELPYQTKHPIILPHKHQLTQLIIRQVHIANLHSGFTLTLTTLRRNYWIMRGRDIVRIITKSCITCRRHRAKAVTQLMGNLPSGRVNCTKAFLHSGVDYAGPFNVKMKRGRYYTVEKSYFAIFVCMATKAIHLEAVTDMTSESFIASMERFIARRGSCAHLYSDNGTNFTGADNILQDFLEKHQRDFQRHLCNKGTQWHFNPPAARHQGGIWEAGVKSVKYHFNRVVGVQTLTTDQFQTILCKIEACLNSRPLCALSSEPTDLEPLTPGHFLVGGPLTSIPDPDLTEIKQNRFSRWETVRQISQSFWKRWSIEYVTTLQQRFKWTAKRQNLEVGDLVVIIMEDNLPMTRWKLGRITTVHTSADGLVRSVTLRTSGGELVRPIVKLSPLLLNNEN